VTGLAWALDGALVLLLLGLAARVVLTRDLFEATVLFIGFGLTLSLVWVRLGAPDLALAEATISRAHAAIGFDAEGFFVEDLGSTNGTMVNGARITRQRLKSEDEIVMGKLRIGVSLPA